MKYEKIFTKDYLEKEYSLSNKTKAQVAREAGTCTKVLDKYFKKFGIPTKSRVCYKTTDLTGQRFGRLVVERKSGVDKHSKCRWYCKCDCGNSVIVNASSLIRGLTKSCVCLKQDMLNKNRVGDISNSWWRRLTHSAVCRGIEFALTKEQIWSKFTEQSGKCFYTGLPINFCYDNNKAFHQTASPDRIDSRKGYTLDNLQLVHKVINNMKGVLTSEQFIAFCGLVSHTHPRDYETYIEETSQCVVRKIRSGSAK